MKLALLQMDIKWEDVNANLARAGGLIKDAAVKGADVAVLPEMFTTGFTMNLGAVEKGDEGGTHKALSSHAAEHEINIVAGYSAIYPGGEKGRNLAAAYGRDGKRIALYQKMHPFSLAEEDRHYAAGEGPVVFALNGSPSSVFICYDLRFPEAMRRVAPDVSLIFVLANWPSARAGHWEALLKARAIENQCFLAGVNRVGTDGNGVAHGGGSVVFGPAGETVSRGGDREEVVLCDIDPGEAARVRAELPFLKDMRA
jgi:predicted amidohydrolase